MAGRSKPIMRLSPISVTGTEVMSGMFSALISSYSTPKSSSQLMRAWQ